MARNSNLTNIIKIDTTPTSTPTLVEISGIESLDWAIEDETQSGFFLSDDGYGYSDVTAGRMTITLSGKRVTGDAAQNYIIGLIGTWGASRKSTLQITTRDSYVWSIPCMIEISSISGGNAEELETFEAIFHSDGKWSKTGSASI